MHYKLKHVIRAHRQNGQAAAADRQRHRGIIIEINAVCESSQSLGLGLHQIKEDFKAIQIQKDSESV